LSLKKLGLFSGANGAPTESYIANTYETEKVTPIDPNPINNGILLSEALDKYISNRVDEDEDNYTKEKQSALRSLFRRLIEDIGDLPIGRITSDDADQFRRTLKKMPKVQTGQIRQQMTVKQLVLLDDPNKLSANTIGQRLNTISSVFNWLNTKNKAIGNPFKGVTVKDNKKAMRKREPFTPVDLKAIFNYKIWSEKKYNNDWEYWLPLILLFTGARVNEIVQLEKKDIGRTSSGIWYISINDVATPDEPESVFDVLRKRIKTETSQRNIPIHSHLIELGFLSYIDKIKSGRIFPDIKPQGGKLAKYPCRRFNETHLPRIGVKSPQKTFYSFRHTALDALKKTCVSIDLRAQIAGHGGVALEKSAQLRGVATGTITGDVYGNEFEIDSLKEIIELLDYKPYLDEVKMW